MCQPRCQLVLSSKISIDKNMKNIYPLMFCFYPLMFFQPYSSKKNCLASQTIRSVLLSRYECAEMQDRFSVFIQV